MTRVERERGGVPTRTEQFGEVRAAMRHGDEVRNVTRLQQEEDVGGVKALSKSSVRTRMPEAAI
jgi:hypothetical protein